MTTSDVIKAYLAARRAQGVQIRSGARALRQFARETGDRPLNEVTAPAVAAFLRGHGALSAAWTTKFRLLAGFYRFAMTRGYVTASPLPELKPKLPAPQTPYVYSTTVRADVVDIAWDVNGRFERSLKVAPAKFAEVCGKLPAGLKVRWSFDANAPLDFNVHYHVGKEVVFPSKLTAVAVAKGVLDTKIDQDYCWMWRNKSTSAATGTVKLQR